MLRTTIGLLALLALLLTGCSGDDPKPKASDPADSDDGIVAGVDGDELCGTVDHDTIEEQFGEAVEEAQPGRNVPPEQDVEFVSCNYVMQSLMEADGMDEIEHALDVSTRVKPAAEAATSAEDAVAAYLVNFDGEHVAFEEVDDLGEAAGYASGDVRLGGSHLVAIIEDGGELFEVLVKAEPEATLDQLRPIADELVDGVTQLR